MQQQLAKAESGGLHKAAGSHVNGSASSETSSGAVDSPDHAEAKEGDCQSVFDWTECCGDSWHDYQLASRSSCKFQTGMLLTAGCFGALQH